MRVSAPCKLRLLGAALLGALLGGCQLPPRAPAPPAAAGVEAPAPHTGVPYDIVPGESLLTIRVYRGGTLGSAGHNHVIAARAIHGTIYVPDDLMRSSFAVRIPVSELSVDEAALRAAQNSAEFPADVPQSAKDGTRRNMLSEALLDAGHNSDIVLEAQRLEPAQSAGSAAGAAVLAHVRTTVAGRMRSIALPVRYQLSGGAVVVSGEAPVKQSDLGLTPFSALLGALQVQDEMRVSFRIVARAAGRKAAGS